MRSRFCSCSIESREAIEQTQRVTVDSKWHLLSWKWFIWFLNQKYAVKTMDHSIQITSQCIPCGPFELDGSVVNNMSLIWIINKEPFEIPTESYSLIVHENSVDKTTSESVLASRRTIDTIVTCLQTLINNLIQLSSMCWASIITLNSWRKSIDEIRTTNASNLYPRALCDT